MHLGGWSSQSIEFSCWYSTYSCVIPPSHPIPPVLATDVSFMASICMPLGFVDQNLKDYIVYEKLFGLQ